MSSGQKECSSCNKAEQREVGTIGYHPPCLHIILRTLLSYRYRSRVKTLDAARDEGELNDKGRELATSWTDFQSFKCFGFSVPKKEKRER